MSWQTMLPKQVRISFIAVVCCTNCTKTGAWLMNLLPWAKTQYGAQPVSGNVLPFPIATMPCMHTFSVIIASITHNKKVILRDIAFTMSSYNIGAVAEKTVTYGVTAFAGKAYMLADGFQKEK